MKNRVGAHCMLISEKAILLLHRALCARGGIRSKLCMGHTGSTPRLWGSMCRAEGCPVV